MWDRGGHFIRKKQIWRGKDWVLMRRMRNTRVKAAVKAEWAELMQGIDGERHKRSMKRISNAV